MDDNIYFSKYELWFLFSQMDTGIILGFQTPMTGLLVEDIFPLVQEASFSLLDRALIYIDSGNQIKIKSDLERLIKTFISSEHTILIGFKLNSHAHETVRSINFEGNNAAMFEELLDGSYMLREIRSNDDLAALVAEPLSDKMFWAPDTEPLFIPENEITLIHGLIENSKLNEAKIHLDTAKGDEQTKKHFLETLQNPTVKFSLLEFRNWKHLQKNDMNGFSVIAGERYIWLLEIVDEAGKVVRVSKATLKELNKKISFIASFPFGG